MRRFILAAMITSLTQAASGAPPEDADPALAPWFNDLRQPWTNALCCSMADCRPTESRVRGDHYEVFVGGEWRVVPDDKVLQRSDNPTGHAVVCWTPGAGILCFVRAPES
jgi:hypothetical protein